MDSHQPPAGQSPSARTVRSYHSKRSTNMPANFSRLAAFFMIIIALLVPFAAPESAEAAPATQDSTLICSDLALAIHPIVDDNDMTDINVWLYGACEGEGTKKFTGNFNLGGADMSIDKDIKAGKGPHKLLDLELPVETNTSATLSGSFDGIALPSVTVTVMGVPQVQPRIYDDPKNCEFSLGLKKDPTYEVTNGESTFTGEFLDDEGIIGPFPYPSFSAFPDTFVVTFKAWFKGTQRANASWTLKNGCGSTPEPVVHNADATAQYQCDGTYITNVTLLESPQTANAPVFTDNGNGTLTFTQSWTDTDKVVTKIINIGAAQNCEETPGTPGTPGTPVVHNADATAQYQCDGTYITNVTLLESPQTANAPVFTDNGNGTLTFTQSWTDTDKVVTKIINIGAAQNCEETPGTPPVPGTDWPRLGSTQQAACTVPNAGLAGWTMWKTFDNYAYQGGSWRLLGAKISVDGINFTPVLDNGVGNNFKHVKLQGNPQQNWWITWTVGKLDTNNNIIETREVGDQLIPLVDSDGTFNFGSFDYPIDWAREAFATRGSDKAKELFAKDIVTCRKTPPPTPVVDDTCKADTTVDGIWTEWVKLPNGNFEHHRTTKYVDSRTGTVCGEKDEQEFKEQDVCKVSQAIVGEWSEWATNPVTGRVERNRTIKYVDSRTGQVCNIIPESLPKTGSNDGNLDGLLLSALMLLFAGFVLTNFSKIRATVARIK
jgi:hypothetical protein